MKKTKDQTAVQAGRHPFRDCRNAGCPLVAYETSDPAQTIINLRRAMNGTEETTPIAQWDTLRGLTGVNDAGAILCKDWQCDPLNTGECGTALDFLFSRALEAKARETFAKGVFFFHNAHRFIDDPRVMQGVWNLRDIFEKLGATLVMLTTASKVPIELRNDVVTISDPLPTLPEIAKLTFDIAKDAVKGGFNLDPEAIRNNALIADTLTGISGFGVRQTFALSLRKDGVDQDTLWERKRKLIEQTPGLAVWQGGETFADIGGCQNVKQFLRAVLTGRDAPRLCCVFDEFEKSMAGTQSDTSGVSQDYLRTLLAYMQDKDATGVIFVGPAGAAKSAVAKASANEVGIPNIQIDLGAMKGSLVGQSEQQLRNALGVIDAISGGKTLFFATCNSLGILPPEIKRRFSLGVFFFDLPNDEEREAIWKIYRAKYSIPNDDKTPKSDQWSGAEIKQCANIAWRLNKPLEYAASFIVPVAKSAGESIKMLREQATGRFISANKPGFYGSESPIEQPSLGRVMKFT